MAKASGRAGQGRSTKATERRFAERAALARGVRLRRWLIGLLIVAVVAAGVWAFYFSTLLDVRGVEVTGADPADRAAVERIAEQERGTPLARVDGAAVGERITDTVPGAKAVEVDRGWPRTLKVKVTSRVPELAVADKGGKYRLLGIEGTTIRTVGDPPKGVPTVTTAGGATRVSSHGVRAASGMLQEMPEDLRSDVSQVTVDEADQVSFHLGETEVVWGDESSPDVKVRVIPVLLEREPEVIDVSAPDTPVTKG